MSTTFYPDVKTLPKRVQKHLALLEKRAEAERRSIIDQALAVLQMGGDELAKRLERLRRFHGKRAALKGLSPAESRAFNFIYSKAKDAGYRGKEIAIESIANHVGITDRQARRILRRLEEAYKVIVRLESPGRPNRFAITLPETPEYNYELQSHTQLGFDNPRKIVGRASWDWKAIRKRCGLPENPDYRAMEKGKIDSHLLDDDAAQAYRLEEAQDYKAHEEAYDPERLALSGNDD